MAARSSHFSSLLRLSVLGVLLVAVAAVAIFMQTGQARAAQVCNNGDSITMGKYWLNSNLWGASSGSGSQCLSDTSNNGSTIGWSTTWNWSGSPNSVKSYDSAVLGWHWGWKIANTGLPVQLSANTSVNTSWSFNLNQTTQGGQDVAYDIWISTDPNLGNANPTDEVMVWLDHTGSIQPVGSQQTTTTIDGTSWNLWEGNAGWNVHSFVRTSNTSSASLNLADFFNYLITARGLSSSKYLISVEAGTEVFTGAGTLNTTAYSVTIGGGNPPTPTPTRGSTPTATPTRQPTATSTPISQGGPCSVHYTVTNQWPGGFGANIIITNTGTTTISGWSLKFSFANGQTITQLWNGSYTQSGGSVTITNLSYNGSLAPGATANPGFNGSWNGSNSNPTSFTLNGAACSVV